ncbi:hypothetical protein DENSPDRAFT_843225 [Dentipellis sp. KUC8613]|nr:hypothetical protein DENSPDRAFT_843225 [Dentipellis sp. KUC8613]
MEDEFLEVCPLLFLHDYAPFCPSDEDVQACFDALLKAGLVVQNDCRYEVPGVHQLPSSPTFHFSSYILASTLCETIAKAQVKDRLAFCSLHQNPVNTVDSELSDSPDCATAYLALSKPTAATSAGPTKADCVVNCQWRLRSCNDDIVENRWSVSRHPVRVMNEDAKRLFTYSMTFEGTQMTLWYWSRSHCAKSISLDITKDIFTVVRILASFIFARADELGFDVSVQRRFDETDTKRDYCLVFRVQDRYFKTLRTISEHLDPRRVTGRSTRVFEVIEVGSFDNLTPIAGATNKILKDVWLDEGARTEKQIQDDLFEDLDAFAKRLEEEGTSGLPHFTGVSQADEDILRTALRGMKYKNYFLTVDCDQQGVRSRPSTTADVSSIPCVDSSQANLAFTPAPPPGENAISHPVDHVRKRQYRVVFDEVCEALHNVRELKTVIRGMQDCLTGLQLMFLAGWVHRDISGGNMLWFSKAEMQGRGVLSDLEYAKKFDPEGQGSADPKTGTSFFMPIEIQRQDYIYWPTKAVEFHGLPSLSTIEESESPRMIHNFEHDLESLFWVFLWTITVRAGNENTRRHVARIFQQDSQCSREREKVITAGGDLVEELEGLMPQELKDFLGPIRVFSYILMNSYLLREFELGNLSTYSQLYGFVRKLLSQCLDIAEILDIRLLPVGSSREDTQAKAVRASAPQTRKRTRKRTRASTKADAGNGSRKSQRISEKARSAKR